MSVFSVIRLLPTERCFTVDEFFSTFNTIYHIPNFIHRRSVVNGGNKLLPRASLFLFNSALILCLIVRRAFARWILKDDNFE